MFFHWTFLLLFGYTARMPLFSRISLNFGLVWLGTPKVILSSCWKLLFLSAGKNSASSPMLLWRYTKIWKLILVTLGMPGYIQWYYHLAEDFDVYLHAKNKPHNLTFFLRYYILKNPAIILASSILAHNSRPNILSDMLVTHQWKY